MADMDTGIGEEVANMAMDTVDRVGDFVSIRLQDSQKFSVLAQQNAIAVIQKLGNLHIPYPSGAPAAEPPKVDVTFEFKTDPPEEGSIGIVDPVDYPDSEPDDPDFDGTFEGINMPPPFESSIDTLNIPPTPEGLDLSGQPAHPTVDYEVTLPPAPAYQTPVLGALVPIEIPVFEGITLPVFSATAPVFAASPITAVLQWTEPEYAIEILDEVMVQVRRFLAGGTGLPPAVEEAIFNRSFEREDRIVEQAVKEAYDEFALRGFTMPPGMLIARSDEVRAKATLAKQAAQRELTIKAAEWEIENLKFACQQGVACENVLVNIHLNMAERMFQAAKYELESQIAVYNAQIALYNAYVQAYSASAAVYKIQVDAELAKVQVFRAEVDAAIAMGQMNEQTVKVYQAQIEAVNSMVKMYTAQIEAVKIEAELAKIQIEAYKVDVEAYATRLNADKVRFEAYSEQVKAEAAKAGIIDSEARAYLAQVQGEAAKGELQAKEAQSQLEVYKTEWVAYTSRLEAEKTRMQYQLNKAQAAAATFEADTRRFSAQAQAEEAKATLEVKVWETSERLGLAFWEGQYKSWEAGINHGIEIAKVNANALASAGQISSTLSAGAMAALHVGASLTGSGSAAAGAQYGATHTTSQSTTESHSVEEQINIDE